MTLPASVYLLLQLACGMVAAGVIGMRLRLIERILIGVTSGLVVGPAASYFLAVVVGLGPGSVLAGPVAVTAIALAAMLAGAPNPIHTWRQEMPEFRQLWQRPPVAMLVVAAVAAVAWGVAYTHALYIGPDGSLASSFRVVWSDWAQHLTTASSFAHAGNVPAVDPLYSGTALLYPFIPDFGSGALMVLGASSTMALSLPSYLMAVTATLLVVVLAQRLRARLAVGVLAALICFLGGGLGFTRVVADACQYRAAQTQGISPTSPTYAYNAQQAQTEGCNLGQLATHPLTLFQSLGSVPAVVINQPRAYDGLQEPAPTSTPIANDQWFTPLEDWWLPQRTLMFGFSIVVSCLILVAVALEDRARHWSAWVFAGVLAGMLPLVHVQTFIALVIGLIFLMAWNWRREWLLAMAVTAVFSAPRLFQMVGGPHGAGSTAYPSIQLGWYAFTTSGATTGAAPPPVPAWMQHALPPFNLFLTAIADAITFFEFWISNLGVALPLSLVVAAAVALARWGRGRWHSIGEAVLAPFPPMVIKLAVSFLPIFVISNIVVFQSWAWDNTKLFVYWYLTVGLLIGCLAVHWVRHWRSAVWSVLIVLCTLGSGLLDVSRYMPWTAAASRSQVAGPWPMASPGDIALASEIQVATGGRAIFVTDPLNEHDPAVMLAGRTTVLGFIGWLGSYGVVYANRQADVGTIDAGCAALPITSAQCPVAALLRRYGVSYVEIGTTVPAAGARWWAAQGLPVTASNSNDGITVYDVRTVTGAAR